MNETLKQSNNISWINLKHTPIEINSTAQIVSWGRNYDDDTCGIQVVLKEIDVLIQPKIKCKKNRIQPIICTLNKNHSEKLTKVSTLIITLTLCGRISLYKRHHINEGPPAITRRALKFAENYCPRTKIVITFLSVIYKKKNTVLYNLS